MYSLSARRWWARASLGLAVLAAAVLLALAGRRGVWLVLLTAAAVVVAVGAGFWFLQQRGMLRWLALAVAVGAPVAVLVVFILNDLLWVAVVAVVLLGAAVLAARTALRPDRSAWVMRLVDAPDPRRPFLVMNPRSGGGKVDRFGLQQKAEALGAEVALLDRPNTDVQQLAREALARGADLLGVAGGDGTQALVAQVAAEHDVPFLVISAGTRNHFALDLGLDRDDPSRCLDGLRDGVEARIDLGDINGRTFVNNASFGAYAEIVDNPAYRDNKRGTTLDALPDLLSGRRGAHLVGDADGLVIDGPQALLVSNNPYETSDLAGAGRRARLDVGTLGVIAVRVDTARQAVGLLHGASQRGLLQAQAREVVVSSSQPAVPVGIDGESVQLSTPVRCTVRPGALRVRLPRERPGVPPPQGRLEWAPLWGLAVGRQRHADAVVGPNQVARSSGAGGLEIASRRHRRPLRNVSRAVAVLVVGITAAACSSASKPAVCSSLDALQTSMTELRNVDVSAAGIPAVQDDIAAVEADVRQVVDDAADEYATNVDQLQADYAAVQAAATAAQASPAGETLTALGTSIRALGDGVTAFADDVRSTC